ncbi:hypothetical protein FFONT_0434 [Fervidicoccus fontis Kam940]|uniref:KEOPS complex subunit n=1 Tax=Fervidicoccus fontis (strain DSM 19380 / JCM 18336 / VKM B-2539 / Kam940) TaxID=1163730 RepID=I0A0B7_FERFK|nr:hypothetical protein FFONT_0434 [Fervidicoccus fontis Kam940]
MKKLNENLFNIKADIQISLTNENLCKSIINSLVPDDLTSSPELQVKTYNLKTSILIQIVYKGINILTVRNTIEDYINSIETVINSIKGAKEKL